MKAKIPFASGGQNPSLYDGILFFVNLCHLEKAL